MPQIEDVSKFTRHLSKAGISWVRMKADPAHMKPIQTDYDQNKVDAIIKSINTNDTKPVIISSDMFVIDGHHRYMAHKQTSTMLPSVQVSIPVNQLLRVIADYLED